MPGTSSYQSRFTRLLRLLLLVFLCLFVKVGWGQNGVTISTTASNPTSQNPIPVTIDFDQPVNLFDQNDLLLTNGSLDNFEVGTPDYNFIPGFDLRNITLNYLDLLGGYEAKLGRIPVAIDVDSEGNIYVLTFGDGIKKYSQNGQLLQEIPPIDNFNSPLDIAINSQDEIYVADNGA
ncbi:MAG: hypothetical protein WCE57_09370, partial [Salegentibacter sp.]